MSINTNDIITGKLIPIAPYICDYFGHDDANTHPSRFTKHANMQLYLPKRANSDFPTRTNSDFPKRTNWICSAGVISRSHRKLFLPDYFFHEHL